MLKELEPCWLSSASNSVACGTHVTSEGCPREAPAHQLRVRECRQLLVHGRGGVIVGARIGARRNAPANAPDPVGERPYALDCWEGLGCNDLVVVGHGSSPFNIGLFCR